MKALFHSRWLSQTVSLFLGTIFLLAAFSKIGDLAAFHASVKKFSFLPLWLSGLAVLTVPGLELALAVCLITRFFLKEAAALAFLLLAGFIALGIYANLVGTGGGCGCFKIKTPGWLELSGWWIVARNGFFLFLAGFILCLEFGREMQLKNAAASVGLRNRSIGDGLPQANEN